MGEEHAAEQIVGPEPREASFASSVIRLSCSVAPWAGQLNRYMPSGSYGSVKLIGNSLVVASALFFLETSFEMYFLTLSQGQQMLGFSLAHIAPWLLGLVFISGIAFLALAVFALVLQIWKLIGRLEPLAHYARFMLIVLCVQVVHGVLLVTYDGWAAALFP